LLDAKKKEVMRKLSWLIGFKKITLKGGVKFLLKVNLWFL